MSSGGLRPVGNDPLSTLRPFLNEIVAEDGLRQLLTQIGPIFWSNFVEDLSVVDALDALLVAFQQLDKFVKTSSGTTSSTLSWSGSYLESPGIGGISDVLSLSLSLQVPPFFSTLMENVCGEAMQCWTALSQSHDISSHEQESAYWDKFKKVTSLFHSLHLFHIFTAFPLSSVVQKKIEKQITEQCSSTYDVALLMDVTASLTEYLVNWLQYIVDNSKSVLDEWKSQLMYSSYETFAKLRISEMFEIIVDYPESEPALADLALCLETVALKDELIISLDKSFRKRLLHPGVNTADIITQYISAVKALRLVDPSGVVLEKVCGPVREYLYNRDDTVRCIVASLTNDCDSELTEALIKGESNTESDYDDHDFDSWEPDPVDANPDVAATTRKSSDIICLLVNIYGSCEMFVSEYRNLLADRLLQMCSYDISREVCTLELLKHRFGENSLHFCEVMLKDVGDSKRIHSAISSKTLNERDEAKEFELQGMILSSEFWPALREESFDIPTTVKRQIEWYSREYGRLKGMRKLEWKTYLGMVDIDILCGEQRLSMTVSPIRAVLLYHFQTESQWTIESLSRVLKAQPSVVRKHVGFWVSHGLLKELSTDEYGLIKEQKAVHKGAITKVEYEDESVMETEEDTMEAELQVYWNYITHMLTNLGPLTLERIHSMLGMFGLQGNLKKSIGLNDLKTFLQKKTVEQQLLLNNGSYSLVH